MAGEVRYMTTTTTEQQNSQEGIGEIKSRNESSAEYFTFQECFNPV